MTDAVLRANVAPSFAGTEMAEKRVFAIVPVKALLEGKSRLSPIMNGSERQRLNAFLMRRTFDLVAAFPGIAQSIAVSADPEVAVEAEARGIIFVQDEACDLNAALAKATRTAIERGADAVVVLPVDLPLATSADLKRIIPDESDAGVCLIVPDRHRTGTNLLYASPPCDDLYRFGPGSFALHREAALAHGYRTLDADDPVLSLDIDEPEDYERWRHSPAALASQRG